VGSFSLCVEPSRVSGQLQSVRGAKSGELSRSSFIGGA